ncbi:hypothetical protein N9L50_04790 [Flavobacteriaceae bacterium]|jgi:hypothetical protein|nr:hypothetical protein [Flavobacteriaceae bacterium]MDA8644588.1 hypothetical protein [Flavobacteriaceae bacterium]MDC0386460.1 hypothetical protein [Flavobacteriaceae bacterium]MDC3241103.1 hypothetical protein [Flavobacteriaceae bacterium]
MKTTYFLFALAFPLMVLAQAPESKKALTKEQRLELHTKKMQLALELSEDQTASVRAVLEKYQSERPKREKTNPLSSDERYEMMMKQMDTKLAIQKEMKSILNEVQYSNWKENMSRNQREIRSHQKPKKMHRNEGRSPSTNRKRN